MLTTLPVPVRFELPGGWLPADPLEAGAPGMLFIAKHPASSLGAESFSANITVSGYRRDGVAPAELADESVIRLRRNATVEVRGRTEVGSRHAPGVTQLLTVSTNYRDMPLELVQHQVYLTLRDVEDSAKQAVVVLVLTCTPRQFAALAGDFGEFVRTVRSV